MDVGDWLRSVGLSQYEATFRDHGIDIEVLPELTEVDFEKLGVLLGHRKRLLKAIRNLAATEKSAPAPYGLPDKIREFDAGRAGGSRLVDAGRPIAPMPACALPSRRGHGPRDSRSIFG
jgi:hypothetical protein